jgi:enoyl-CoA hydratase/carnithine racemase
MNMPVSVEKADKIAVITIDNGPLNLLTPTLHKELYEAILDFDSDRSVRVGILTGKGSRAFCAGDDIKAPRSVSAEEQVHRQFFRRDGDTTSYSQPSWERDIMSVQRFKPIVAGIVGWCIGQGFVYACHLSDIRVAGRGARFGLPEISYGMSGAAAIAGIFRHMPRAIAMSLALTGDWIDAEEAQRCFLVNEVVSDDAVLDRARVLAERISRHPALALRVEMEALQHSQFLDPAATYRLTRALSTLQRMDRPDERPFPDRYPYSTGKP